MKSPQQQSQKVAVLLSGAGCFDGAEIHESVLTLLSLSRRKVACEMVAPNKPQLHVINHLSGEAMPESRNVLIESARIARGKIKDLAEADPDNYAALVIPGGYGAAKNLFDFALKQNVDFRIDPAVKAFIKAFQLASKPVGFICISPMMIADIYPKGVKMTIGNDRKLAEIVAQKGSEHIATAVDDICVDKAHKVVSTPAYMLGQSIDQVSRGIDKLIDKVLALM